MNQLLAALAAAVSTLASVASSAVAVIQDQTQQLADAAANPGGAIDTAVAAAMTDATQSITQVSDSLISAVRAARGLGTGSGNPEVGTDTGSISSGPEASSTEVGVIGSITGTGEPVAQAGAVQ